jgi:hypothetical protein
MQNMPQLNRLACVSGMLLGVHGVRAFQSALQMNRTLRELSVAGNNVTMDALNISTYDITSACLVDITRLLELTRLQTINFGANRCIFNDDRTPPHTLSLHYNRESLV